MKVATLRELLFVDDCALNSNTEAEMQQCVNHFSRVCDNFGFTISTKKREVMHQHGRRKMHHEPHIFVNDEPLKASDSFTYPGSALPREANIDVEVSNRLSKANSAFGRLSKKVWDRRAISQDTKLKVYVSVVLTVLLCACESWPVYSRHVRKLNHFHTKCLRIILSRTLTRAGIPSIHTLLQKAQVRWEGHVTRMPDGRRQNSSYMVSSATESDPLVGKRNASRKPLSRPSQASTLMSPTGKPVPRIDPCGAV